MIDPARLERILVQAAREGRPVTYRQMLGMFGLKMGSGNVARVCRVLGEVERERTARGEPELACLLVRQGDGLPGEGYFSAEEPLDPAARLALVKARQAAAFAWALTPSSAGRSRKRPAPDRCE